METVRKNRNYVQNAMVKARKYSGPHKDSHKEDLDEEVRREMLEDFYWEEKYGKL